MARVNLLNRQEQMLYHWQEKKIARSGFKFALVFEHLDMIDLSTFIPSLLRAR